MVSGTIRGHLSSRRGQMSFLKCKRFINCLNIKNSQKILTGFFFGGNLIKN